MHSLEFATAEIEQTENELKLLQTEKRVLSLKRQQLEANMERARRMADERAEAEEAAQETETAEESASA